eukprot:g3809.t1
MSSVMSEILGLDSPWIVASPFELVALLGGPKCWHQDKVLGMVVYQNGSIGLCVLILLSPGHHGMGFCKKGSTDETIYDNDAIAMCGIAAKSSGMWGNEHGQVHKGVTAVFDITLKGYGTSYSTGYL